MLPDQEQALRKAHTIMQDHWKFLELWACNRLDEVRLITDIAQEIQDVRAAIHELEQQYPEVDPAL
jgi:hypothetical protein